jgi:hypothetical protein
MQLPQEFRDASNVEYLLKKTAGSEQSKLKREAMWVTNIKTMEGGLSKTS